MDFNHKDNGNCAEHGNSMDTSVDIDSQNSINEERPLEKADMDTADPAGQHNSSIDAEDSMNDVPPENTAGSADGSAGSSNSHAADSVSAHVPNPANSPGPRDNGSHDISNSRYNPYGSYNGNSNYGFDGQRNGNQNRNAFGANGSMGSSPYGYRCSPPYAMPGQKLANAAMVLGIISVLSTILMTIYIPLILGSTAVILAILSKGTKPRMAGQAMTGLICGISGLAMNLGILVTSLSFIFSNPELLQDAARIYDTQFEQIYGESTEDVLGQSLEDMINETFGLE